MFIFSETYSLVYNQIFHCHLMFYNGVTGLVTENLDRLTKEIIFPNLPSGLESDPMKRKCEDEKLLEAVYNAWSDHMDSVKKVSHVVEPVVCHSTRALPHTLNVYST
jgi:cullin 3